MKPVRIVVADDHELLLEGFHTMLAKHKEIELSGEARNGEELVKLVADLQPEVVITDIKMPRMDGIEATKSILQQYPHVSVIAFTMFDEETLIVDMLEAGAQGYLLKSSGKEELLEAIGAVREGKTYYCRQTTNKLAQFIARSSFGQKKIITKPLFTEKELTVIRLICGEYSNKEIAQKMNLSTRTVEGYREKIQEKMKIKNTAGIVVFAIRAGIFKI